MMEWTYEPTHILVSVIRRSFVENGGLKIIKINCGFSFAPSPACSFGDDCDLQSVLNAFPNRLMRVSPSASVRLLRVNAERGEGTLHQFPQAIVVSGRHS